MEGLLQTKLVWWASNSTQSIQRRGWKPGYHTTDKLDEPSETESSDEEDGSEDSDDSDCEYDVY